MGTEVRHAMVNVDEQTKCVSRFLHISLISVTYLGERELTHYSTTALAMVNPL